MQTRKKSSSKTLNPIKFIFIGLLLLTDCIRGAIINRAECVPEIETHLKENMSDICKMPKAKALCKPLGVPRKWMPQLTQEVADKYFAQKEQAGYRVESGALPADELTPLQNEMHGGVILGIYQSAQKGGKNPCEQEVVVAHDAGKYYIIDGHHRRTACALAGGKQRYRAVHDSVDNVLDDLKHFSGVTYDGTFFKKPSEEKRVQPSQNSFGFIA